MPELASAQLLRGRACKALHRFAEAADAFRFILALFPDFAQMRVNLAHTALSLAIWTRPKTQLQMLSRAIQVSRRHMRAWGPSICGQTDLTSPKALPAGR